MGFMAKSKLKKRHRVWLLVLIWTVKLCPVGSIF